MARKRFHGLKKVKVRASWNKFNLYNISRLRTPSTSNQTFYQQKWSSKSLTRAYHGEQIREKQWQRMFTSKLDAVIPMDHRYLAEFDGSELAAGRGSGVETLDDPLSPHHKALRTVPYMNMIYAPIERRLDMAIFRALFASSARQARQFVVHGKVKVNGQKMPYPGYLLNPGDMYQVDVESVLFGTGAIKDTKQRRRGREIRRARRNENVSKDTTKAVGLEKRAAAKAGKDGQELLPNSKMPLLQDALVERRAAKEEVELLIKKAQFCLTKMKKRAIGQHRWKPASRKEEVRANARQAVKLFTRKATDLLDQLYRIPAEEIPQKRQLLAYDWLDTKTMLRRFKQFNPTTGINLRRRATEPSEISRPDGLTGMEPEVTPTPDVASDVASVKTRLSFEERLKMKELKREANAVKVLKALKSSRQMSTDLAKPYATPWEPRPYMSAFAFIPRYLEVNHKICSAVYLRHPVARPGLAEVPSPFPAENLQLAFNWYLRRR